MALTHPSLALLLDGVLALSVGVAIWLWIRLCQELKATGRRHEKERRRE